MFTTPDLTRIDSTALFAVGSRYTDGDGNVYIYLSGGTSIVEGSVVTYYITSKAASVTALLAEAATGQVAIALAATVANKFGWFQVAGINLHVKATADGAAAAGATPHWQVAGIIDDAVVADSQVFRATFCVCEGAVDYSVNITDGTDATLLAAFAATGEIYAAKGSAIAVGDIFRVGDTDDMTDNALEGAKGSAPAANDLFRVTNITDSDAAVEFIAAGVWPDGFAGLAFNYPFVTDMDSASLT